MDDRASRTKEINTYKKRTYKRVPLELKIADYERIRAAADAAGETVSGVSLPRTRGGGDSLLHHAFHFGFTTAQFSASFNRSRISFFRLLDFPEAMSLFRPRSLASSLLRTGPMFFSLFILSPVHFLCFSGYLYLIFTSFLHSKKDRISAILYANPRIRTGLQWHSFVC